MPSWVALILSLLAAARRDPARSRERMGPTSEGADVVFIFLRGGRWGAYIEEGQRETDRDIVRDLERDVEHIEREREHRRQTQR